jgi:hypothetical protein
MSFSLPTFNVTLEYWAQPDTPFTQPLPDGTTLGQIYISSRGALDVTPGLIPEWVPPIWVRTPLVFLSHLISRPSIGGVFRYTDITFNSWCLAIRWWMHMHRGFPNEYAAFLVEQCGPNGTTPDPLR